MDILNLYNKIIKNKRGFQNNNYQLKP